MDVEVKKKIKNFKLFYKKKMKKKRYVVREGKNSVFLYMACILWA